MYARQVIATDLGTHPLTEPYIKSYMDLYTTRAAPSRPINKKLIDRPTDRHIGPQSRFVATNVKLSMATGGAGRVIEVRAKSRTGEENFISCMRKSLEKHFHHSGLVVAMGGVFVIGSLLPKIYIEHFECEFPSYIF